MTFFVPGHHVRGIGNGFGASEDGILDHKALIQAIYNDDVESIRRHVEQKGQLEFEDTYSPLHHACNNLKFSRLHDGERKAREIVECFVNANPKALTNITDIENVYTPGYSVTPIGIAIATTHSNQIDAINFLCWLINQVPMDLRSTCISERSEEILNDKKIKFEWRDGKLAMSVVITGEFNSGW